MRDANDTCVIICPMENVDPMGFHTGESIVVAPTQTLSDEDFQKLRNSAQHVIRSLKIEGGCNIQFAFNYLTGEYFIIEVNPRVSRSSALASKATGYPIARIAAKIAIGMHLDEIPNDITKETPACFEPTIDYCVVKIPRWPFDKFRFVDKQLGTQMKSTGETMALGRTFEEALQKAVRSLEIGRLGLGYDGRKVVCDLSNIRERLVHATDERLFSLFDAFSCGLSLDEVYDLTGINKWFLSRIENIYQYGMRARFDKQSIIEGKRLGFCDAQLSCLFGVAEEEIRAFRKRERITPCFKMVDTCAGEFAAKTPYFYSTYEDENEALATDRKKVIILGSGPIRIGQGIEFDYSCIHGVFALREAGYEAIIINNNPETVSTDFDISDRLYFEPLTFEDVMNVIDNEKPEGVIVQFGGQTAINLALRLEQAGVRILGTSPHAIDLAEDREKFGEVLTRVGIPSPEFGFARSLDEAREVAARIGYPILVRPSYVLGGRAMEIVSREEKLVAYMREAVRVSEERPVLIDRFLGSAIELDVDVLCDGSDVFVAAIMEHIEHAGVHSGDSSCVIPPQTISEEIKNKVLSYSTTLARTLGVVGLLNIQYAVKGEEVFILEANPRASRTIPYVSKTIGIALADVATKLMLGEKLSSLSLGSYREPSYCSVKTPVFPFHKLAGLDPLLSPEMKSTGEVMGIDRDFGLAYYKAQLAAGHRLPEKGNVFVSIGREEDKIGILDVARALTSFGYMVYATQGTAEFLTREGVLCISVPKIRDNPKILEMMRQKELALTILIARGGKLGSDGYKMRRAAVEMGIPYVSTVEGARAVVAALQSRSAGELTFRSLREYYSLDNS